MTRVTKGVNLISTFDQQPQTVRDRKQRSLMMHQLNFLNSKLTNRVARAVSRGSSLSAWVGGNPTTQHCCGKLTTSLKGINHKSAKLSFTLFLSVLRHWIHWRKKWSNKCFYLWWIATVYQFNTTGGCLRNKLEIRGVDGFISAQLSQTRKGKEFRATDV